MGSERRQWAAYFDESGGLQNSTVFVVAGYFVHPWDALKLEAQWAATLKEYDLPYFHMVECAHQRGVFSHLARSQCSTLVTALIASIHAYVNAGFAVVINPMRWSAAEDAYAYSVVAGVEYFATSLAAILPGYENNADLKCVFEDGHSSYASSLRLYADRLRHSSPGGMANPPLITKQKKRESGLLQAADMLAWQTAKFVKDRVSDARPARGDYLALVRQKHRAIYFNDDGKGASRTLNVYEDFDPHRDNPLRDKYIRAMCSLGDDADNEMDEVHAFFDRLPKR